MIEAAVLATFSTIADSPSVCARPRVRLQKDKNHNSQRIATVLMFLSEVEEGGETVFPNTAVPPGREGDWSPCGKQGIAVKAKKGNALLFWSMKVGGELDGKWRVGCSVVALCRC